MIKPTGKINTGARMLPHNIETEQAVLGCVLIDTEAPHTILNELNSNDFYTDSHKNIFSGMQSILLSGKPIDYLTLTDELDKSGLLDSVGGIAYISTLTNIVPSAANYKHYMEIVKRDSILRKLIAAAQEIIDNSYTEDSLNDALSFAERSIFDISKTQDRSNLVTLKDSLIEVLDTFNSIYKDPNSRMGLKTGLHGLDYITRGLQKSDLILLAARPGFGKSSLAMNIVEHAAIHEKKTCAVFNLEMPRTQLAQRAICTVAHVDMEKALNGKIGPQDFKKLTLASEQLGNSKIFVDDSSLITPSEILSKCRRLKREQGLDLIVVDYLQLMTLGKGSKADNRQQEISEISRSLKILAKELQVPVLALSQLSRAVESRSGHRPMLSDLRESGAIEQDADIVMFIDRQDRYNEEDDTSLMKPVKLIIAKHRNGKLGDIDLVWDGSITQFRDMNRNANLGSLEETAPAQKPRQEDEGAELHKIDEINDDDLLKSF